jgi:hypothetical protein
VQLLCTALSVLITLWITNLQSKVTIPLCLNKNITPDYAYSEQTIFNLITLVVAKKENGDLTDAQIMKIKANYKLSETMSCYCEELTHNGFYIWKLRDQHWADYDPLG